MNAPYKSLTREDVEVGDPVIVIFYGYFVGVAGRPLPVETVTKITAKKVYLSDGRRIDGDGEGSFGIVPASFEQYRIKV